LNKRRLKRSGTRQAFRYPGKNAASCVAEVDFSRLAREIVARFKKIVQQHGIFPLIEMLDAFRYGKINQSSSVS